MLLVSLHLLLIYRSRRSRTSDIVNVIHLENFVCLPNVVLRPPFWQIGNAFKMLVLSDLDSLT